MGVSLETWQRIAPPELHALHPDHRDYAGPREAAPPPKRSKYRNQITTYKGRKYHSKAEAVRAEELDWLKESGQVREWTPQPRYTLGCPENIYVSDFEVVGADGAKWTEDVKGIRTAKCRKDFRLWRSYGPHPLRVITNRKVVEVIVPTNYRVDTHDAF